MFQNEINLGVKRDTSSVFLCKSKKKVNYKKTLFFRKQNINSMYHSYFNINITNKINLAKSRSRAKRSSTSSYNRSIFSQENALAKN